MLTAAEPRGCVSITPTSLIPIQQAAPGSFCLLLRTSDPGKLIAAARAEIYAIDLDLPVYDAM